MPRRSRPAPIAWTIDSVTMRGRDGPRRLEQAYRLLVAAPAPLSDHCDPEGSHGSGHLRPRLDRASGSAADD